MLKFEFEIVQTVSGLPDPSAYPMGLARTKQLNGSAKVVVEEFPDANTASQQACGHEGGNESEVWQKHCPEIFKNRDSIGGLDVYYLGPVNNTDDEQVGVWTLFMGCHKKTIMSRDTCHPEPHDSLQKCRDAVAAAEKSWARLGYFVWFAKAKGPDGKEHKLHEGVHYDS